MENENVKGYITEKIINAFLAGSVPIYYGTREVFDIFNVKSFVYYDIDDPKPSLEWVSYLEWNRSAYDEVLSEPILKEGNYTIEKYFSFRDSVGGGKLKEKIRKLTHFNSL